jgi:hypothetical protein
MKCVKYFFTYLLKEYQLPGMSRHLNRRIVVDAVEESYFLDVYLLSPPCLISFNLSFNHPVYHLPSSITSLCFGDKFATHLPSLSLTQKLLFKMDSPTEYPHPSTTSPHPSPH